MDAVREFCASHGLDTDTVEYLCVAVDEAEVADDVTSIAGSYLSAEAVEELLRMAPIAQKLIVSVPACTSKSRLTQTAAAVERLLQDTPASDQHCGRIAVAADEVAASKPTAKVKGKAKVKATSRKGAAQSKKSTECRNLHDLAEFGLAETEEGLDAFDSAAITGKGHLQLIKHAALFRDIVLPAVHISIVTDLGQKDLICGSPLTLVRGQKYGLVGRNGCGKTTLLRRIARRSLPGLPPLRYGYVVQELVGSDQPVLDFACSGDTEYTALITERIRIEADLASAAAAADADEQACLELTEQFAEVTERLDQIEAFYGADGLEGHAKQVLLGLQFSEDMLSQPTKALSGGWKMRLGLARALLSRADCLLLDEPTNHLDLTGVFWLQHYLRNKVSEDMILVVISHDREFLDSVVTNIVEVSNRQIQQGTGNYSQWELRKAEYVEAIGSKLEAVEKEEKRQAEMVQRMREQAQRKGKDADPNKLRQAKERQVKAFGKVNYRGEHTTYGRIGLMGTSGGKYQLSYSQAVDIHELAADALACDGPKVKMKLPEPEQLNGVLMQTEGAKFMIPEVERVILSSVSINIQPDSRVAVVGANGAGKSTLLRLIGGEQWPSNKSERHPKLKIGYISQHHLQALDAHLSDVCLEYLRSQLPVPVVADEASTKLTNASADQMLCGYLGSFGLGAQARQKIGTLSGGQKARFTFACAVWFRPSLLLMDEPTNHLDMETIEALTEALKSFAGAAVIVSHNQHFLTSVCTELWVVDGGKVLCSEKGSEAFSARFQAYKKKALKQSRLEKA